MGAACVWKTPSRWIGLSYHLCTNKGVFDVERYVIYQSLSIMDRKPESGHRYTAFVDSTAAIEGSGRTTSGEDSALQSPPLKSTAGCFQEATRLPSTGSHLIMEFQSTRERMSTRRLQPTGERPRARPQTSTAGKISLSHMAGVATEARSRLTAQRISDHVKPKKSTSPPAGKAPGESSTAEHEAGHQPLLSAPVRTCGQRAVTGRQGPHDG